MKGTMKQEDRDTIVKIFSETYDKYAEEQRRNIKLKAMIADLEIKLSESRGREIMLHEMREEQGGL